MKKNIIIIFGGKSSEHDISVITGIQTIKNINRDFFNAFPLYISKGGVFYFGEKLEDISTFINFNPKQKGIYPATFISGKPFLLTKKWFGYTAPLRVDCAIICCHGLNGEDGTISGLLDISCIPYSCSNTLSCATCMDKIIMKDIFKANNFKIVNHTFTIKSKFIENSENELVRICATVKFPQIVKPTNLGSSIGISKCKNKVELFSAITLALKYDDRVVVEEMVENLMEVNCAVKGTTEKCEASLLEQPLSYDEILTFKEKYLDSKKLSEKEVKEENEIDLTAEQKEEIKQTSISAFKTFVCNGVVRIDYLINKKTNEIFINEINSIPGSLAYYLFENDDYNFSNLITELINIAIFEQNKKIKREYNFNSPVILNYMNNLNNNKLKIRKHK